MQIGAGSYGTVYKVKFQDKDLELKINPSKMGPRPSCYALKELVEQKFIKEGRIKEVFIELCVLKRLDHPSIIKLFFSFKQQRRFYLLLEHCSRGSLLDFLKRNGGKLSNNITKHYMAEVVAALAYLRR